TLRTPARRGYPPPPMQIPRGRVYPGHPCLPGQAQGDFYDVDARAKPGQGGLLMPILCELRVLSPDVAERRHMERGRVAGQRLDLRGQRAEGGQAPLDQARRRRAAVLVMVEVEQAVGDQ